MGQPHEAVNRGYFFRMCLLFFCPRHWKSCEGYMSCLSKVVFRFLDAKPCIIIMELLQERFRDRKRDRFSKVSKLGPVRTFKSLLLCLILSLFFPEDTFLFLELTLLCSSKWMKMNPKRATNVRQIQIRTKLPLLQLPRNPKQVQ